VNSAQADEGLAVRMEAEINRALSPLAGKRLWGFRRAADLAVFHFGARRVVSDRGSLLEVGDYALHLQCAWRIVRDETVLVGSGDVYYPPESVNGERAESFDWDRGPNLRDLRLSALFEETQQGFLVSRAQAENAGSFEISFELGLALQVFPDDSVQEHEHWRLFVPDSDKPHFVVTGTGIED
jgi:hypothetical protein